MQTNLGQHGINFGTNGSHNGATPSSQTSVATPSKLSAAYCTHDRDYSGSSSGSTSPGPTKELEAFLV
jgi:hypothetical protein